jgi:hypothetical protein
MAGRKGGGPEVPGSVSSDPCPLSWSRTAPPAGSDGDLNALRERLKRLRPRDREVVRALIAYYWLPVEDAAVLIQMGTENFRARTKHVYRILGVENRLHLFAQYHVLGCELSPHGDTEEGVPAAENCSLGCCASCSG